MYVLQQCNTFRHSFPLPVKSDPSVLFSYKQGWMVGKGASFDRGTHFLASEVPLGELHFHAPNN